MNQISHMGNEKFLERHHSSVFHHPRIIHLPLPPSLLWGNAHDVACHTSSTFLAAQRSEHNDRCVTVHELDASRQLNSKEENRTKAKAEANAMLRGKAERWENTS